ncbi:hypothetical protein Rhe02_81460 [Rhizocola hellebori]|uniref:Uncharacterized protein n=1 Tax=Rhizocola hellebori TaxID=1392758 RepID=A0A8J3QFN1_9ACTN|nr:hypothetical protein [Rhizocola hellebori]GIH10079.1 hypothetical protein Rhe02_81460 [Rhizocola hellebori]
MTHIIKPPVGQWRVTVALMFAAVSVVLNLIGVAFYSGLLSESIEMLPVQSRPEPATASQVEAVAEVTLPPGTVFLAAAYSNGLETMLSAKFRIPRDTLDAFLASAALHGTLTPGLHAITTQHDVGRGNLWHPETAVTVTGLHETQPTSHGTYRTVMLDLDAASALTVYLHARRS